MCGGEGIRCVRVRVGPESRGFVCVCVCVLCVCARGRGDALVAVTAWLRRDRIQRSRTARWGEDASSSSVSSEGAGVYLSGVRCASAKRVAFHSLLQNCR